jgi:hypothetical protein
MDGASRIGNPNFGYKAASQSIHLQFHWIIKPLFTLWKRTRKH